jgi:exopolysaccharide biosynthesis polyprenyl glycosylphosphotransferase
MEGSFLPAADWRVDSAARSRRPFIELPMLGFGVFALDAVLFALPGLLAASGAGILRPGTPTTVEVGLALCLGAVLFFAVARWLGAHDGVALVRRSALAQVFVVFIYFAGPIVALFTLCSLLNWGESWRSATTLHWLLAWGTASTTAALGVHLLSRPVVNRWRTAHLVSHRVAIVGSGEPARRLVEWIEANAHDVVEVVGLFDDRRGSAPDRVALSHLVRGTTDDLIEYYRKAPIDKVIVALPHQAEERLLTILQRLKQLPVDIALAPDPVGFRVPAMDGADLAGLQMTALAQRPLRASERFFKELFDRSVAALLLLILSPLMLATALAVKFTSPGPVFFRQERHGLGNRIFHVLKFRSMRTDLQDVTGAQQTQRNDARVTTIGNFLRRTSIDELPQLLNVLMGDMSLVGPRPLPVQMRVEDRLNYEIVSEYAYRHRVKPGITGWAQVKGHRGAIDTAEGLQSRVAFDLYYIENWSLWLDIKILFMTGAVCALGKNAF